jgi:hypothetical protein
MRMYDAVLIPGGGVREDGILPPWVTPRFDRALELAAGACFMPLSAGTTHRPPPLDSRGFPISEARAGAAYLMSRGVESRNILMEESSLDTVGNAWFSRMIHVVPRGFERLLVITSAFHMPRTEAVFRWVYELDGPGPRCKLTFEEVPDIGIDAGDLRARLAKEAASIRLVDALRTQITTLPQFHEWLFTVHGAYAAKPAQSDPAPPEVAASY